MRMIDITPQSPWVALHLAWKRLSMSYESRSRVRCNSFKSCHGACDGKFCVVVREIGLFFLEVNFVCENGAKRRLLYSGCLPLFVCINSVSQTPLGEELVFHISLLFAQTILRLM